MKSNDFKQTEENSHKKYRKRKLLIGFIFWLVTLFLLSFSTTSFILVNSYRLTYAEEDFSALHQEIGNLKNEILRKNEEIEELKLQLANMAGESSFVSQMQNNHSVSKK